MKVLIVGLGNPGKKYIGTRHNVGFRVVDELAKEKREGFILAKPRTFMNQSGKAVKQLIENCCMRTAGKLKIENLIVVHDDIDLPIGGFRIQKGRGAAGHKGVQSIIDALGTKDFWRIRIGICPKTGKPKNVEKFVLQKFTKEEEKIIKKTIKKAILEIAKI
ncbi:MAG: hypothetical protein DRZ76_01540 [Candidatus Nealsonbacteria bacterium]|nr:MAG: hypothetical protein DRZ76_01540 [Candidatus Nealsonbacteria bacterium]